MTRAWPRLAPAPSQCYPSMPKRLECDGEHPDSALRVAPGFLGFGGDYPIIRCSVQAKRSGEPDSDGPGELGGCHSSQGPSEWGPWLDMKTKEGVPDSAPSNVSVLLNGTEVLVKWMSPLEN
ncbi:unnamed protein product [Gadus morhua 'NCC']